MIGNVPKQEKLSSPEEELAFLRKEVARREQELAYSERGRESAVGTKPERKQEQVVHEEIRAHGARKPEEILTPSYVLPNEEAETLVLNLLPEEHDSQIGELLMLAHEKGVRNALSVLERMARPHLEDDFHRALVEYIKEGHTVAKLPEKRPLWNVLHMTLYEIALPEVPDEEAKQKSLKELISGMEQFYAGMLSIAEPKTQKRESRSVHFTLEIAVADKSDEIVFYASVPDNKKDLFEKQLLSIFPNAQIHEQKNDYNIFVDEGVSLGSYGTLAGNPIYPLKTYEQFDYDPLNILLNVFSKIEKEGGGAAVQIVFRPIGDSYNKKYKHALHRIHQDVPLKEAISFHEGVSGEIWQFAKEFKPKLKSMIEKSDGSHKEPADPKALENIERKIKSVILKTNIRIAASAHDETRTHAILTDIESAFNQFEDPTSNRLTWKRIPKRKRPAFLKEFSFREFSPYENMPLSITELTSLMHLPPVGIKSSPQFKQSKAGSAPAPFDLPAEGTLLGVNRFRNVETKAYLTKEDRLRHFYAIGQTGTGKTTFLKNMIVQDIEGGEGVCMIDPHGVDIVDVLGMIPPERYGDVIYFDPAYTPRSFALNMLEYDPAYPEQKTFVINELFSIFQKLYGAIPESMGPMFEQYFRNATALVLEDPASGSTLLDVSRVLVDSSYRELKLTHSQNPVVNQFWREIATKAGGESSLANIVPYITSKFDVFTANDYMRPLIAQEKSSFNFRKIMDERKILLVNLAKGRLGDINSNLIGLIIVGKILMAALSRVDSIAQNTPPFYLYIDEFQNVTTNSIATILSEARKYKLSLTVAHQFIAQLNEQIRDAVFGNVGSMAVFRVGAEDAKFLESQFTPVFKAQDLMNIDNYNCYLKLLANGRPTKPFNIAISPPPSFDLAKVEILKQRSYETYGTPREEVEARIRSRYTQ